MKKFGILCLIGMLWAFDGIAQEKLSEEKRKEFEAQKVAFFTQKLELTPQEAAVFWPLYNELHSKMHAVESGLLTSARKIRETKNMTEAGYKKAIQERLQAEQKMTDLKKEYTGKMLEVIPAAKVWKLEEAERKFHRQLFERLKRETCAKQK